MIRAQLAYLARRHGGLLLVAAVVAVLFLGSFVWLHDEAFYLWAGILVAAVVVVQVRQGPGGDDPRFEAEEAARRAERHAAIMRGES